MTSKPDDRHVWSASTYVDELRSRRDRELERAEQTGDWEYAELLRLRARTYEECAALCELTSDRRAWPPVFDAMAAVIAAARQLCAACPEEEKLLLEPQAVRVRSRLTRRLADVLAALDAALDARTTLPETVETDGHRGCRSECARCAEPELSTRCGDHNWLRRYDPDASDPWDPDCRNVPLAGGTFR
jgi:hypothetical protein